MTPAKRCSGTNESGEPCGVPPSFVGEDGFCPAHREGGREKMKELAQRGAQASKANREPSGLDPEELGPLEGHADAKKRLDLICRAVLTGRISDRRAQAAIRAVSEWVKAHEGELTALVVEDLQEEVERLQTELDGRPKLRREK